MPVPAAAPGQHVLHRASSSMEKRGELWRGAKASLSKQDGSDASVPSGPGAVSSMVHPAGVCVCVCAVVVAQDFQCMCFVCVEAHRPGAAAERVMPECAGEGTKRGSSLPRKRGGGGTCVLEGDD